MTKQTLFSPAMAALGAVTGAAVWLILHTNGLLSSVHLGLPLLSFIGGALGYSYGVLLERQGTSAKQGLLKGGVRLLFPALALVLVVVGLLMKNRATSCWGFFFLILALVPDSIAKPRLAAAIRIAATVFAIGAYVNFGQGTWLIWAIALALAALTSLYTYWYPEKAKQVLDGR